MNRRERILALIVVGVGVLAVGGFLFKYLFYDAMTALSAQIKDAQDDLDKKKAELAKESQDEEHIKKLDPRLALWQDISLPQADEKAQAQEVKAGAAANDVVQRHVGLVQVEYETYLRKLVEQSGFASNSLKISSATADRKGGPILTGKTPAYTRMQFTVQGTASFGAVVRMLEDFHKAPLLHEVRNLTLTSKPPARTNTAVRPGGVPGAAPGGVPGAAPGGFPGAAPGGFPGAAPGGFPPAGPGGALGGLAALGNLFGATQPAGNGDLDVQMTVEALMVTGAHSRDKLLPDLKSDQKVETLAEPARTYSDMLAKNMFTGIAADSKLTEVRADVLGRVKLTAIWSTGRRWEATFYDQGKGGDEKKIRPPVIDDFSVSDKYDNVLVKAKVLKLNEDGMIFKVDDKCYRWRVGEFLGLVMETALKPSELKDLGINAAMAAPTATADK